MYLKSKRYESVVSTKTKVDHMRKKEDGTLGTREGTIQNAGFSMKLALAMFETSDELELPSSS